MRAVSLALLGLLAVAVAAQVNPANPSGDWKHPTIQNMTTNPQYNEEHILYGNYSNTTGWHGFSWLESSGLAPAVRVSRNKDVEAWDYIKFESLNPAEAYYTAGWAEGFLTFDSIYVTYVNQVRANAQQLVDNMAARTFINQHVAYERNHENKTAFGQQLHRQMRQIDGIYAGFVAGYEAAGRPANVTELSWQDIYLVSYMEELTNVLDKYPTARNTFRMLSTKQTVLNSPDLHCSALLKLTDDDLFFAHDTWSGFNTMVRQFKTYVMPEATVVMSGYPGSISSIDDWYMTSLDLAVQETTNGFQTASLMAKIRPNQVSEFNRVMIGNFIATSPLEWMQIFNTTNSGTYNNQYMVANMKVAREAIRAKSPLPAGTFYVGEQIPGLIVFADQTEFLNTNKHWPSYNVPFYRAIQQASGYDAQQGPDYYGMDNYNTYSRAVIFKRMQGDITDLASMYYMMRYNNWQQDPASTNLWCKTSWNPNGTTHCSNATTQSASQTIASRYDLNVPSPSPNGNKVGANRYMFGAIDSKITSATMMEGGLFRAVAINGPTRVQQPVWDYKAFIARFPSFAMNTYYGLPSRYAFSPVHFEESGAATPVPIGPAPEDDDNKKRDIAIGVGVAAAVCVVGVGAVLFFRMRSTSSPSYDEGRALV